MKRVRGLLKLMMVASLAFFCADLAGQSVDDSAVQEIDEHRKKQEAEFRDSKTSPLHPNDLKKFKGLNYYPVDLKYRVRAQFIRNQEPVLFKMKTSTARLPDYSKYGEIRFRLDSVDYVLEVYQSLEVHPGYEDYLFIPFTDQTNGHETYAVGRYIDFRVPASEDVIIDFNQCYNPYCSYSNRYSCPIPPAANALPVEIKAGEKKFKDSH